MKTTLSKQTIITCVLALLTFNSFAQKNFYVKLNGGYNMGIVSYNGRNQNQSGTITNYEKVPFSLSSGIQFGGAAGYMFSKFIGAELGVSYLIGNTVSMTDKSNTSSSTENVSSRLLNFTPSLVITPGLEKLNPYAKFGLSLGLASITDKMESTNNNGSSTTTSSQTRVFDGGMAIGFMGTLGLSYKINDKVSLIGELNIASISYSPTKGENTEYKINGVDMLSSMPKSQKNIEFVDSYSQDNNSQSDPNSPSKSIAPSFPFSSVGLNIGVMYKL